MNQINISVNTTDKDIEILRSLFKKYSKQVDGYLSQEQLSVLVLELSKRPLPYETTAVFQIPFVNEKGLDEDTFVIWYLGFISGLPHLSMFYSGLKNLQKHVNSAAPLQVNDQSIKHSYIKFESQTNQEQLKNQIYLDVQFNPHKTRQRVQHYQKILKKIISPTAIALSFQVNGKAAQIKQKVQEIIEFLKQLANQLPESKDILQLLNISVGHTETQVVIVIETSHILFRLISDELNSIINNINPNLLVELSLLIKSNSLSKILSNTNQGFSSSLALDLKIDGFLLQRIRESIIKTDLSLPKIFGLLLEEIRLQVKTNNIKQDILNTLGIPSIDLGGQVTAISQQMNVQAMIEGFLPQDFQGFVKSIKNAQSADVNVDLFVGCFNLRLNLKLQGTNQVFGLIL